MSDHLLPAAAVRGVSDVYLPTVAELHEAFFLRSTVRILVVVDSEISLTEGPSAFGVGRVVRLLRESTVGCTSFRVDLARRNNAAFSITANPAANQPRYQGFRFNSQDGGAPVLNRYDEVWCFGFKPGNDAGPDANITSASSLPASDAELAALTTWMNDRRGGLLAMGDHDYLGASMCHRIPRIRSMRRWTNAQGVPPIGGESDPDTALRHDTNQPFTAAQLSGSAEIPFSVQEDSKPQGIDWVPWISQQVSIFKVNQRPHPILCHPTHGPIDVMPDHPHEGWNYEDDEIDLTATYSFGALSGDEYPTVGSNRPAPMVIAHGTTTPNPPFDLAKGPSPKKRFAMVTAYDGHQANVGRVVTDTTWHHWFDENIQAIEAAGGANWDKISRYYLNVATWLAPPGRRDWCIVFEAVKSQFSYLGFQEYKRGASVFELGRPLHAQLSRYLGPCWVTSWVFDRLALVDDDIWAWLKNHLFWKKGIPVPAGDSCLSCPPFELFEIAVLGGLVRATFEVTDKVKAQVDKAPGRKVKLDADRLLELQDEGAAVGVKELRRALAHSVEELKPLLG
jgi:hypothetical protein